MPITKLGSAATKLLELAQEQTFASEIKISQDTTGSQTTTTTGALMTMSDMLVCFTCCIPEQPPPRRRKIDRSMIGLPTNFTHTGHIGSGDMAPGTESNHLNSIQVQMSSKGGYEHLSAVTVDRKLIDVQRPEDTSTTEE